MGCHIAEERCKLLNALHSKVVAQTLPVHLICWKMWPQSFIPGGQMLTFSFFGFLRAVCQNLWSAKHTNCYHKFCLQGIFVLLHRCGCADLSFTVKKEWQFWAQKLPLPSSGAFQPVSLLVCGVADSSLAGDTNDWLYYHFSTPSKSCSWGKEDYEALSWAISISLCTLFCISLLSHSKFLHGRFSSHHISLDYLDSVK